MNKEQADVLEFYDKVGKWSRPDKPEMLSESAANRCIRLMDEELDEFIEAYEADNFIEMIDALVDLIYVTYGTAIAMGVDLEEFWREVQRSNMSKFGGKLNEFGKLVKPDTYSPADIKGVFEKVYGHE